MSSVDRARWPEARLTGTGTVLTDGNRPIDVAYNLVCHIDPDVAPELRQIGVAWGWLTSVDPEGFSPWTGRVSADLLLADGRRLHLLASPSARSKGITAVLVTNGREVRLFGSDHQLMS